MGWEAVMRVRVSRGWKITKFYGHLFIRGVDLLVVPNCHSDQTFAITIDMEENVTPDPVLCVQSALLYTNCEGERRIRVHTWAGVTTQNFSDIINSVDVQATTALLSNIALETSIKQNQAEGRNKLNTVCQQVVQANNVANSEALQFLPLYIMGMLKSPAFRGSNDIGADLRTYIWMRLETLTVSQLTAYYYPRLMALHNLAEHVGVQDENGRVTLPDVLNLTKDSMTQDGIYLQLVGSKSNVPALNLMPRSASNKALQPGFFADRLNTIRNPYNWSWSAAFHSSRIHLLPEKSHVSRTLQPFTEVHGVHPSNAPSTPLKLPRVVHSTWSS